MSVESRSSRAGTLIWVALTALAVLLIMPRPVMAATCNDAVGEHLISGNATTDLEVTGPCEVKAGTYTFHNINIFSPTGAPNGGSLTFDDAKIDLFAESIVVEAGGALIAGSPSAPIGTNGGVVTIHLWGRSSDPGVTCKTNSQCGVPNTIWSSNTLGNFNPSSCTVSVLPGDVSDCFYSYETLDDGDISGAYFGHKVLALSYDGTIQMFGKTGATYPGSEISNCKESDPSCSGTSWVRLDGSLKPGDQSLTVDGLVDWQVGNHIVVTTTDYLPGHSEELIISDIPAVSNATTTIKFTNADGVTTGVKWPHNGQQYDYSVVPARLGLKGTKAETRAAVGLLSRNIRIVSEGNAPVAASFVQESGNYYGGHTIVRQGFRSYQVQGVEFYQLGQGGSIMHYPVHFHMARHTPETSPTASPITFVKDCSIHDSMTRWITIHATQGVLLARNVGYLSIGHGFYLEDGTETDNKLYSNLGVFARAAVANVQNPRDVPGILTHADSPGPPGFDNFPYFSDANHPAVFWIMNGANDFEYNMAAGAGTCGACYWFVPGAISGTSQKEKWFGYASMQQGAGRAGITPLTTFVGNYCTSAMNGFTVNSDTATCNGVNFQTSPPHPNTTLQMLPSTKATANYPPPANDTYWPIVSGGGRLATLCPAAEAVDGNTDTTTDCSGVHLCANGNEANCAVTTLANFTTSFNWAQQNFASIWIRPFWGLVTDSFVSDAQNGGINFVTSGGYSKADVINGFWALARKTVFVGSTQTDNPLASEAGPFNPLVSSDGKVKGLTCAVDPISGGYNASDCLSKDEGVAIQLSNFSLAQRFFSVYDGPAYQDSNAYLNIHPTYLTSDGTVTGTPLCAPSTTNGNPCVNSGFMNAGLAGLKADQVHKLCYFPNAGIGWKQPNGFYYAPAFHSDNLFFDGVDIRHFVTEPLFLPGTFNTDVSATQNEYCFWGAQPQPGTFTGFTDIDRETVLNDDDGSLTGLTSQVNNPPTLKSETISVNKENFFNAPVCTAECASDLALNPTGDAKLPPNTANTSPYEYVTAAVFPECALTVPDSGAPVRFCADGNWGSACTTSDPSQNNACVGLPLYRQYLNAGETAGLAQQKRMMGQNTFQRSGLTANHGVYYIDTTVSAATQKSEGAISINAFTGGDVYDLFFLYSNAATTQKYILYLGTGEPANLGTTNVKFGLVDITTAKYRFRAANGGALPPGWSSVYEPSTGYLTITTDMSSLADAFDLTKPAANPLGASLCQPSSMCAWNTSTSQCQCNISDPTNYLYAACHEKNAAGQDAICSWSVKDLDCPAGGCPAVQITFPTNFVPDDAANHHRPAPVLFTADPGFEKNWNVPFNAEAAGIAGAQCAYSSGEPPDTSCPTSP
ncbi:MAG TPA: G8 domain-containing protein [Candidatus Binataceae bacterium]|nr:G8 domain-containing protein [Candidatus Binataceae bacterium]